MNQYVIVIYFIVSGVLYSKEEKFYSLHDALNAADLVRDLVQEIHIRRLYDEKDTLLRVYYKGELIYIKKEL